MAPLSPVDFWQPLKFWWYASVQRYGTAPSRDEIRRWYGRNAANQWKGGRVPSLKQVLEIASVFECNAQHRSKVAIQGRQGKQHLITGTQENDAGGGQLCSTHQPKAPLKRKAVVTGHALPYMHAPLQKRTCIHGSTAAATVSMPQESTAPRHGTSVSVSTESMHPALTASAHERHAMQGTSSGRGPVSSISEKQSTLPAPQLRCTISGHPASCLKVVVNRPCAGIPIDPPNTPCSTLSSDGTPVSRMAGTQAADPISPVKYSSYTTSSFNSDKGSYRHPSVSSSMATVTSCCGRTSSMPKAEHSMPAPEAVPTVPISPSGLHQWAPNERVADCPAMQSPACRQQRPCLSNADVGASTYIAFGDLLKKSPSKCQLSCGPALRASMPPAAAPATVPMPATPLMSALQPPPSGNHGRTVSTYVGMHTETLNDSCQPPYAQQLQQQQQGNIWSSGLQPAQPHIQADICDPTFNGHQQQAVLQQACKDTSLSSPPTAGNPEADLLEMSDNLFLELLLSSIGESEGPAAAEALTAGESPSHVCHAVHVVHHAVQEPQAWDGSGDTACQTVLCSSQGVERLHHESMARQQQPPPLLPQLNQDLLHGSQLGYETDPSPSLGLHDDSLASLDIDQFCSFLGHDGGIQSWDEASASLWELVKYQDSCSTAW